MAKQPKKLDELFHDTLKDIYFYFAEKKFLANAAEDGESRGQSTSGSGVARRANLVRKANGVSQMPGTFLIVPNY